MSERPYSRHKLKTVMLTVAWIAFGNAYSLRAQVKPCDEQRAALEQQLQGRNQVAANLAAHCIADKPGELASTLHALVDVVERKDTSEQVKETSVWAAGKIAEEHRVDPYLAEELATEIIPVVGNAQELVSYRKACAYTLGRLSDSLPNTPDSSKSTLRDDYTAALVSVISDRSEQWVSTDHLALSGAATDAIDRLGLHGPVPTREIIKFLQDSRKALAHPKNPLTKGQVDGILGVQDVMVTTLSESPFDNTNPEPGRALLELLQQEDNASKRAIIYALGNMGPRQEIQDGALLIISQLTSGDSGVRRVTAYALGRIHPEKYHSEALAALRQGLTDSSPQVRVAAAQAIDQFDERTSLPILPTITERVVSETDPDVRAAAARTLASLARKAPLAAGTQSRTEILSFLGDAETKLNGKLGSLNPTDSSYPLVKGAFQEVKQSEKSIRGSWIRSFSNSHPAIAILIGLYGVWLGICILLIRCWPLSILSWNRALSKVVDLDIPLPLGLGRLKIPLRHALFIGMLNYRPRVLDAWVNKQAGVVRQTLLQRQTVRERQIYVPLPVSIRTSSSIIVASLKPENLRETCDQDRWCIRILGEGGAGKTSLACQLAFWCLTGDQDQRISTRRRSLPVLLEPGNMIAVENEATTLTNLIRSQLQATARLADQIDSGLFEALLRTRRIVVIVDGASEMALFTKSDSRKLDETFPACALIVTARSTEPFGEGGYTDILPQRIDSDHLIPFMNAYLAHLSVEVDDSRLYEACKRLSIMVGRDRGITPLLAQMYARTLVGIPDVRSLTPHLPQNIPELMLTYLEVLNRAGQVGQWNDMDVQRASKCLAWECIRDAYHPGRGSKVNVLNGQGSDTVSIELFSYLEHRLRLVDTIAGASFQFVLDPLAEYFGAIYVLEHNRSDEQTWSQFLASLDSTPTSGKEALGFLMALNDSLEWLGISLQVPRGIAGEVGARLGNARAGLE